MDRTHKFWIWTASISAHVLSHEFHLGLPQLKLRYAEAEREARCSVERCNQGYDVIDQVGVSTRKAIAQDPTELIIVLVWRQLLGVNLRDQLVVLDQVTQVVFPRKHGCNYGLL